MIHPENNPLGRWDAEAYLHSRSRRYTCEFRDAAVLADARLDLARERDILDIGCANASLSIAAANQFASQQGTGAPNIVGIDSSQVMVDQANDNLRLSAPVVQASVRVRKMDVTTLDHPQHLQTLQALFPNRISVIFFLHVFGDLALVQTQQLIRFLMSLLKPGGRIIFTAFANPHPGHSTLYTTDSGWNSRNPDMYVINLSPPEFQRWAVGEVEQRALLVPGDVHVDGLEPIAVGQGSFSWMGDLYRRFCELRTCWPSGNAWFRINSHASFHPADNTFWRATRPEVEYKDCHLGFIETAVGAILDRFEVPPDLSVAGSVSADGFRDLLDTLTDVVGQEAAPDPAANWVFDPIKGELAGIEEEDTELQFHDRALVLATLYRANTSSRAGSSSGSGV